MIHAVIIQKYILSSYPSLDPFPQASSVRVLPFKTPQSDPLSRDLRNETRSEQMYKLNE